MKTDSAKKEPLFYVSPSLVAAVCLIGVGYAALHSFLNKEWGRGVHDYSEEAPTPTPSTSSAPQKA